MNGSTVRWLIKCGSYTNNLIILPRTIRSPHNFTLKRNYVTARIVQLHQQHSTVLGSTHAKQWKQNENSFITINNRYFSTTLPSNGQTVLKPKSPEPNDKRRESKDRDEKKIATHKIEKQPKNDVEATTTTASEKSAEKPEADVQIEEEKLSLTAQFKKMYKEYWYVLLPVHIFTSTFWFAGFYYMSTSGVDIPSLLESMKFSEGVISNLRDSSLGHAAIAYLCYKIATPLRYMVTLGGTTVSIKYLSRLGYIRPVPTKAQLKQMIDDQKAKFNK